MQIDDMLLLRMNRQYLFTPAADELTVLRGLCGMQAVLRQLPACAASPLRESAG